MDAARRGGQCRRSLLDQRIRSLCLSPEGGRRRAEWQTRFDQAAALHRIVAPYAITLAFIGLLESLLTAQILDDMTDTGSDKNRECRGQGVANVATGFLGGMAGCAMIGQSMINIKSGGRTRLSTFSAGFFLLVLILVFGDLIAIIPMGASALRNPDASVGFAPTWVGLVPARSGAE